MFNSIPWLSFVTSTLRNYSELSDFSFNLNVDCFIKGPDYIAHECVSDNVVTVFVTTGDISDVDTDKMKYRALIKDVNTDIIIKAWDEVTLDNIMNVIASHVQLETELG